MAKAKKTEKGKNVELKKGAQQAKAKEVEVPVLEDPEREPDPEPAIAPPATCYNRSRDGVNVHMTVDEAKKAGLAGRTEKG